MSAGISLSTVASVVGIATGVNALFGGGGGGGGQAPSTAAGSVTAAADPLAPFRANLASMYSGYLQPGASADVTQMPGYTQYKTGIMDPAMDTAKRSAAAKIGRSHV